MTKHFWISLAITALTCVIILTAQVARAHKLEQKMIAIDQVIANSENVILESQSNIQPGDLRTKQLERERDAETIASDIRLIVSGVDSIGAPPWKLLIVLPDVLRIVQDLGVGELMAVADAMRGSNSGNDIKSNTRMLLYLLVAEHDPMLFIAREDITNDRQIRESFLGILARRDPGQARRWVTESKLTDREKARLMDSLTIQTLASDVTAGLELLRESGMPASKSRSVLNTLSGLPFSPEMISEFTSAMEKPQNESVKPHIISIVLADAAREGGISAARERAKRLDLDHDETAAYLGTFSSQYIGADPEGILSWIQEALSPEQIDRSLPSVFGDWAEKDFNAAGHWLGEMETSPTKDKAIIRFSERAAHVDPESAVVWATQISDRQKRSEVVSRIANFWIRANESVAQAWLQENGFDLEEISSASED